MRFPGQCRLVSRSDPGYIDAIGDPDEGMECRSGLRAP
jgi:hypothetical protein